MAGHEGLLTAQAFARLSAVYGGTYMLSKPDAAVVYEDGKAVGVSSMGETARCGQASFLIQVLLISTERVRPLMLKMPVLILHETSQATCGTTCRAKLVVGDPSYFPEKTRRTSRVVRAICLLGHPIPGTDNATSAQIILPQRQVCLHPGPIWPVFPSPLQVGDLQQAEARLGKLVEVLV